MIKVESIKLKGWKEREAGVLIGENDDWVLVKYILTDYLLDGYKLYNKKYIKSRKTKKNEEHIERVLWLKKVSTDSPPLFEFAHASDLLKWCESNFGLFEFQTDDQGAIFYGNASDADENYVSIRMVDADGKIDPEEYDFELDEIRTISFGSDYFEAIRLLMLDEQAG